MVYQNVLNVCTRKEDIKIELPETDEWDPSSDQGAKRLTFYLAMRNAPRLSLSMYEISSVSVLTQEGWLVG